ncbi:calcium-binding protein [Methylobacterium sp. Leaf118]|uniref:calcium-binding protein n=1 Tax=Methylobacterium sp. Leaf118 TaxID=2876562 RepID=UPI001E60A2FF|nr:calcium-binding protein [Methylobacterium sp. Leaf118]
MGTFTIHAAPTGFKGDAPYGGSWGYPLEYVHEPLNDVVKFQDVWASSMLGAFFTLQGTTQFVGGVSSLTYTMDVAAATFYRPMETIDGIPQVAIEIGTATFDPFTWSGGGGYVYGWDGEKIGYRAYIQGGNEPNEEPSGTPLAGNAFGGHIASMDLIFNGSEVEDYIEASNLSGVGRIATFNGGGGDDTIIGSYFANNYIYGGSGADHLRISSMFESELSPRSNFIDGGVGNDYIDYNERTGGDALLLGGGDNDTIYAGGSGNITIDGGSGNDVIFKNGTELTVTAKYSSNIVNYAIRLVESANGIYEVVDIRAGSPEGRDTLNRVDYVSFDGQVYALGAAASDKVAIVGTNQQDTLAPEAYVDNMSFMRDNIIYAHAGDDIIDGGYGADVMIGGQGSDIYYVDNVDDRVFEAAGQGNDTVYSSVSFSLAGQDIENLTLTGSGNVSATGNSLANTLIGNAGNNSFDGGTGIDIMRGLGGNDTYIVDNAGDRVIEAVGGGRDSVVTSVSYALAAGQEIEELRTVDKAAKTTIALTGNQFVNKIVGDAGNNRIDGGGGADSLHGGAGSDTYLVDHAGDQIVESKGGGWDSVVTTVDYTLSSGQEIEELRILQAAGDAPINLTGNALAQNVICNGGANTLNGGWGNDVLTGRGGADTFVFSNAPGTGNIDRITDFAAEDTIQLSSSIFTTLAPGQLDPNSFKNITTGKADADDRIMYKQSTGELFYDADGSGAGAKVKIAMLDNKAALFADDFFIV